MLLELQWKHTCTLTLMVYKLVHIAVAKFNVMASANASRQNIVFRVFGCELTKSVRILKLLPLSRIFRL